MIADNIAAQTQDTRAVPPPAAKTAPKRSFADLLTALPTSAPANSRNDKLDETASSARQFRRKPKDPNEDTAGAASVAGTTTQTQPASKVIQSVQTDAAASADAAATETSPETQTVADAAAKLAALAAGETAPTQNTGSAADLRHKGQPGHLALPPEAADLGAKVAAGAKKLVSQPGAALATLSPLDARFAKSEAKELHDAATATPSQNALKTLDPNAPQQPATSQNATDAKNLHAPAALAADTAAAQAAVQNAKAQSGDEAAKADAAKTDDAASPSAVPLATGAATAQQTQEAPKTEAAQRPTTPPPPVLEQVAFNLKHAVTSGLDQIEIQLRPASLGAIQVKLDLTHDGKVTATVTADRQDTLQLLQRDSSGLQQALRDAGLQADSNSLSFNLRGDPGSGQQQFAQAQGNGGRTPSGPGTAGRLANAADDIPAAAAIAAQTTQGQAGRLDIQV